MKLLKILENAGKNLSFFDEGTFMALSEFLTVSVVTEILALIASFLCFGKKDARYLMYTSILLIVCFIY